MRPERIIQMEKETVTTLVSAYIIILIKYILYFHVRK